MKIEEVGVGNIVRPVKKPYDTVAPLPCRVLAVLTVGVNEPAVLVRPAGSTQTTSYYLSAVDLCDAADVALYYAEGGE